MRAGMVVEEAGHVFVVAVELPSGALAGVLVAVFAGLVVVEVPLAMAKVAPGLVETVRWRLPEGMPLVLRVGKRQKCLQD